MANFKISDLTPTSKAGDIAFVDDYFLTHDGTTWPSVPMETETRMDRLEKLVEGIADRLAVLDNPDPEKLAQFETLKEAYNKYKFVEKLCGEKRD